MAIAVTTEEYSDYINLAITGLSGSTQYSVRISPWGDVNKRDIYWTFITGASETSKDIPIYSCLQGHTYTWYLVDVVNTPIADGTMRLKQPKLFGSRSPGRKRTLNYYVECELCGFKEKRNVLRRGYVKPHVTGVNYLPNGAAPENWTVGSPLSYDWDANVSASNWRAKGTSEPEHSEIPFFFPQIDKSPDFRTPPGQNHWPGIIHWTPVNSNWLTVTFGNPTSTFAGYCVVWLYAFRGSISITTPTGLEFESPELTQGWHRFSFPQSFNTGVSFYTKITYSGSQQGRMGFGGAMAIPTNDITLTLPHRSSAVGQYTTGGMMNLCPDCYSGLRRRVPWET